MRSVLLVIFFLVLAPAVGAQDRHAPDSQSESDWRQSFPPQDDIDFPALEDDAPSSPDLPKVLKKQQTAIIESENVVPEELSPIEAMYAGRVMDAPRQFGYEIFSQSADGTPQAPMGAVQDDYVLGIGDTVTVSFNGQRNTRENVRVDTQGMLMIEDFPPVTAAGLTLAQLRGVLEERALDLHNTQIYVTMASVRQIGVLVVGNVKHPGRQNLTVFNTVLDALMQSGGVTKDGSLRQIKLVRGGESIPVDLYDFLLQGGMGKDLTLRDGDRVVVPPIGATVAVSGSVKRPGIYEIKTDPFKGLMGKSTNRLSLREMLQLGGGVLGAGQNRFMHLDVRDNGYEVVEEVKDEGMALFGDGAVLVVARGKEMQAARIQLLGQTRKPGLYDLAQQKTLSRLRTHKLR